jgi:hypothetical protein
MHATVRKRKRHLSEEEAYRRFNEVFDLDLFALELEYDETISAMIREGVKRALDEKQRVFDAMLTSHPATLAENARRTERTRLEKERLEKATARKEEREERRRRAAVGHLARRWGAKLVVAQAG